MTAPRMVRVLAEDPTDDFFKDHHHEVRLTAPHVHSAAQQGACRAMMEQQLTFENGRGQDSSPWEEVEA